MIRVFKGTSARKRRQLQSLQQFKNATNKTTKATLIENGSTVLI